MGHFLLAVAQARSLSACSFLLRRVFDIEDFSSGDDNGSLSGCEDAIEDDSIGVLIILVKRKAWRGLNLEMKPGSSITGIIVC